MASYLTTSALRSTMIVILVVGALTVLFLMYFKSLPSPTCHPSPSHWARQSKQADSTNTSVAYPETSEANKSVVLLWFWPDDHKFPLKDCRRLFNIDDCRLTDDRSLYNKAHGVVIYHKAIKEDLSNIPSTRPKFQRWIWLNMDSPTNMHKIEGIKKLFNLTLTYRKDSDIHVRWKLAARRSTDREFVFPKKERMVCWAVNSKDLETTKGETYSFFTELSKHIKVELFDRSSEELKGDNYFSVISSCKFYLSFENSRHTDYITEIFSGPLAVGTVPVVWGPPRRNYEKFAPGTSFIHVNDFADATALANFLKKLDSDNEAYMKYFDWWKFYTLRRHFTDERYKYAQAICQACRYVGTNKDYRVVTDLYKWFLA